MTASSLAELAGVRRLRRPRPPRLRLLTPPADPAAQGATVGRGMFVAVIGALVLAGMAALLLLNTTLAQGAFDLQQLRSQHDDLQVQEQSLAQQVELAQSPEALRAEAKRLGMVPVQVPAFLRLSDGTVLGEPTPARARVTREAKLSRGAAGAAGTDAGTDAAVPTGGTGADTAAGTDAATGTGGTDAASPTGGGAAAAGGGEGAEDAAARDARRAEREQRTRDDGAVAGPEGAEGEAAPNGEGDGAVSG